MKKTTQKLFILFLATVFAFSLAACGKQGETPKTPDSNATGQTQSSEPNVATQTGLWENATYLTDTEVGQGSKSFILEVKADNQQVRITVRTDEETVGAALLANNIIAGDEGQYGLYIKTVNGMLADFDVDQTYWAFYIDGEYAMSGVDSTDIKEGSVYTLERTK